MLLGRLVIGLLKGLVVGALAGYGLARLGFAMPGTLVAYGAAAALGVIVALVAGKPIWAKGARIEVGMKALAGALIAPALLYVARRWVSFGLPFDLPAMLGLEAEGATLGTFAVTSYAMVAAVLAGFFDADNDPREAKEGASAAAGSPKKRIAAKDGDDTDLADLEESTEVERRKAGK